MNERVSFFLKPEAIPHADKIHSEIEAAGFLIERLAEYRLTARELSVLYPDLSPALQGATNQHLLSADVYLFLIAGEDAVNWLLQYAGLNVNPKKCRLGTVRRRYGSKKPIALGAKTFYYQNGIHRPRNRQEAQRDLSLFFN